MGWAVLISQWLVFYFSLVLLALISLVWNFAAFLLHPFMSEDLGRRTGRAGIFHGYRLFWWVAEAIGVMRLDVKALDPLGDEPGGLILVANHPTLLDGVVLASRLPRASCIMSSKLLGNVFIGAGARFARYICSDQPLSMIKKAVFDVRAGGLLIIFPEGTRTLDRAVNPFKPGVTLIAKKAGVPLQTVFIEARSPYLTKGWSILKAPPLPIEINVRLGERFEPEADHGKFLSDLEAYFLTNLDHGPVATVAAAKALPSLEEEVSGS